MQKLALFSSCVLLKRLNLTTRSTRSFLIVQIQKCFMYWLSFTLSLRQLEMVPPICHSMTWFSIQSHYGIQSITVWDGRSMTITIQYYGTQLTANNKNPLKIKSLRSVFLISLIQNLVSSIAAKTVLLDDSKIVHFPRIFLSDSYLTSQISVIRSNSK